MRVHFCVPFQYEVYYDYGLLAILAVMNTVMSLCIPGYHFCISLVSLVICQFIYCYISYLVHCVGAMLWCVSLLYSSTCIVSGVDVL